VSNRKLEDYCKFSKLALNFALLTLHPEFCMKQFRAMIYYRWYLLKSIYGQRLEWSKNQKKQGVYKFISRGWGGGGQLQYNEKIMLMNLE
jgi:hypothetical protein